MRDVWKPDRNLNFDGEPIDVKPRRWEPKNIPDHLTRPPIDEEVLMKLRTMGAKKEIKKNLSIAEKREMKLEHKRKSELNLKIKKAEKNIKEFFAQAKKILERDNEELIIADCGSGTVEQAKAYESSKMFIRFLYAVSVAHTRNKQRGGPGDSHNKHLVYDDYSFNINR